MQDLPLGQFMATKGYHRLLEFADAQRYAGFLERQLRDTVMQIPQLLLARQQQAGQDMSAGAAQRRLKLR